MKDKKTLIIGGIVVVVVVAAVTYYLTKSDEEGPIIVKNGSMIVETAAGNTWTDSGPDWVHDPAAGTHSGELYVKVSLTSGPPCVGSGHPIQIDFDPGSPPPFQAIVNVVGGGSGATRTSFLPRGNSRRTAQLPTGSATERTGKAGSRA